MEFKEFTQNLLKDYANIVFDNLKTMGKAIEDDKAEAIFSDEFTKEVKKECEAHLKLMNAVSTLARQNNLMNNKDNKKSKNSFVEELEKCTSLKELIDFLANTDEEEEE